MQFKQINRDQPEQVWGVFTNKTGANSVKGRVVSLSIGEDLDGSQVVQPTTALLNAIAGVMLQDSIVDGEPVLIGIYGVWPTLVKPAAAATVTEAGDRLIAQNASYEIIRTGASDVDNMTEMVYADADLPGQDTASDAVLRNVLHRHM